MRAVSSLRTKQFEAFLIYSRRAPSGLPGFIFMFKKKMSVMFPVNYTWRPLGKLGGRFEPSIPTKPTRAWASSKLIELPEIHWMSPTPAPLFISRALASPLLSYLQFSAHLLLNCFLLADRPYYCYAPRVPCAKYHAQISLD